MQRIVVGVDGSAPADRALAWAVDEAELRDAELEVVHCYVLHTRGVVMNVPDQEDAQDRLDEILARNRPVLERATWTADIVGVARAPSVGLVDAGLGATLIVVGSRGAGGFEHLRLGSTGYRAAAHATTPVAVIGDDAEGDRSDIRAVVVGVDGSPTAARALRWAIDDARHRDLPLTVVHAYDNRAGQTKRTRASERHEHAATRRRKDAERIVRHALDGVDFTSVGVDRVLERGSAADALLSRSGPDRLLVVGTHGRGAIGRMVFGSVSHQCLHHASGPVVVVP